ncbi:hypothetical protein [Celeribacter baekdonensis]|uniref:TraI-like middle domain-containing protein n=2 Tax=Roseobacteraceae TaxID=2854170 RepID=K2JGI2_9RHOB|nr:hypothetical protein [Celeribacter baekdonensis]EKE74263.1 hypothetical protein B30_01015 [Celeribacter baekdonensis B30]
MEWIQIRFDDNLGTRVHHAALRAGQPMGAHIRDVLDVAVRPGEGAFGYKGPKHPHALQAYLAHDFAYASGWDDLQEVLRAKGYELAERGGGLILQTTEGERLCKASQIGQPYSALMKRFGAPFTGHAHTHLAQHSLGQATLPF